LKCIFLSSDVFSIIKILPSILNVATNSKVSEDFKSIILDSKGQCKDGNAIVISYMILELQILPCTSQSPPSPAMHITVTSKSCRAHHSHLQVLPCTSQSPPNPAVHITVTSNCFC